MTKKIKINPIVKTFELKSLNPAVYNPRTITENALEGLAHSIKKFGCVDC